MNIEQSRTAIIFGGRGAESDVSCKGAEYLLKLTRAAGLRALPIFIDKSGLWHAISEDGEETAVFPVHLALGSGFLSDGCFIPCTAAFPLLHGDFGEDGSVQGALECAGIPYVGAGVASSVLSLDKAVSKLIAESLGIPTLPWVTVEPCEETEGAREKAERALGYPMFIKPSSAGSSFGAHPVEGRENFAFALTDARKFGTGRVIVEKMLKGPRELEVAFFEGKSPKARIVTHPGEVVLGGFYDYREKYSADSHARICPRANLPSETAERLRGYADMLASALGLRQLGRLDFFLSEGEIYFNEVNTMPGFTSGSLYPKMMAEAGISPHELVLRLLKDAAEVAI